VRGKIALALPATSAATLRDLVLDFSAVLVV